MTILYQCDIWSSQTLKNLKVINGRISVTAVSSPTVPTEHEELDSLYNSMLKVVNDGLVSFEKSSSLHLSSLQCTLMVLKAACTNNPGYMDG